MNLPQNTNVILDYVVQYVIDNLILHYSTFTWHRDV